MIRIFEKNLSKNQIFLIKYYLKKLNKYHSRCTRGCKVYPTKASADEMVSLYNHTINR